MRSRFTVTVGATRVAELMRHSFLNRPGMSNSALTTGTSSITAPSVRLSERSFT